MFKFDHKKLAADRVKVFKMFKKFGDMKYPMSAGCCSAYGGAPDGLQNAHAYTVLDVLILKGEHVIRLRNPWSKEGYSGAWSDKDPRWTPALLK